MNMVTVAVGVDRVPIASVLFGLNRSGDEGQPRVVQEIGLFVLAGR